MNTEWNTFLQLVKRDYELKQQMQILPKSESQTQEVRHLIKEAIVKMDEKKLSKVKTLFQTINPEAEQFGIILAKIYGDCEVYDPIFWKTDASFIHEKQLEKFMKIALDKIEKLESKKS